MASTKTLLQIRDAARKRADMENSAFWTDPQITYEINASAKLLYNFLVETFGDEYYVSSTTDASVADQATYALPSDFFKLLGIDVGDGASPTNYISVKKFSFKERNTRPANASWLRNYRYRLEGSNYRIIPTPKAGVTFRVWYVPVLTELSADGDTFDGVHGYEEFIVLDVAIKMLQSEESETAHLEARLAEFKAAVIRDATSRDIAEPHQVQDVGEIELLEDFEGLW